MKNEGKRVPFMRFKGFSDEWELRKWDKLFYFPVATNSLSRAQLNYNRGEVKNVHYGDILVMYGSILEISKDKIPFITNGKIDNYKPYLLKNGDIIFADAAEDTSVGKAVEVRGITSANVVSGLHTIVTRPKEKTAAYFFGYYVNSNAYHGQLLRLIQGTKVSSISKKNLLETIIFYPNSLNEQKKIGVFFKQLDNLITLHQCKLDALKQLKKGFLQLMFPKNGEVIPELRFAHFEENWGLHKLGELGKTYSGIGFPESEQGGRKGIPFYKVSDMNKVGNERAMFSANNYVNNEQIRKKKWTPITSVPAVIFAKVGAAIMLNRKRLVYERFLIDNNTMAYSFDNSWKINFGQTLFETINLPKYAQVGALPSYNGTDIESILVKIPNKEEQEKIGSFFHQLNNIITFYQDKLDKLNTLKKGYLQSMFI